MQGWIDLIERYEPLQVQWPHSAELRHSPTCLTIYSQRIESQTVQKQDDMLTPLEP